MKYPVYLVFLGLWAASSHSEVVNTWKAAAGYQYAKNNPDSYTFYTDDDQKNKQNRQLLLEYAGETDYVDAQLAAFLEHDGSASGDLLVKELFWHHDYEGFDLMVGKRRIDYGVSYAFRPLDLFLSYQRNPIALQVEEGVGIISASHFTETAEISVFYTNSHLLQQDLEVPSDPLQRGVGGRYYQLIDDSEWQLIGYWDDQRSWNIGGGYVTTINDAIEFHSELRYQHHYLQWSLPYIPDYYPAQVVDLESKNDCVLASVGITWSDLIGNNIIVEYWLDQRAWRADQWQSYAEAVRTSPISTSLQQVFTVSNLNRNNVMLHWSLDSENSDFTPTLDYVFSPDEGSQVITARGRQEITQSANAELSFTYYAGRDRSAFMDLSDEWIMAATWTYSF